MHSEFLSLKFQYLGLKIQSSNSVPCPFVVEEIMDLSKYEEIITCDLSDENNPFLHFVDHQDIILLASEDAFLLVCVFYSDLTETDMIKMVNDNYKKISELKTSDYSFELKPQKFHVFDRITMYGVDLYSLENITRYYNVNSWRQASVKTFINIDTQFIGNLNKTSSVHGNFNCIFTIIQKKLS